jgi:hypothetical protein
MRIVIDGASRLSTSGCAADGLIGLPSIYTTALAVLYAQDATKRHGPGRAASCLAARGPRCTRICRVAPLFLVYTTGVVDIGLLTTRTAALAGATRIGAEHAGFHPADKAGMQSAVAAALSFGPPLTFPTSFPETCECADGNAIA